MQKKVARRAVIISDLKKKSLFVHLKDIKVSVISYCVFYIPCQVERTEGPDSSSGEGRVGEGSVCIGMEGVCSSSVSKERGVGGTQSV